MTFWLSLLLRWVLAQPLDVIEHAALMSVYDGLGSSCRFSPAWRLNLFFFVGCNANDCPRFDVDSNCTANGNIVCVDGKVTQMCVRPARLVLLSFPSPLSNLYRKFLAGTIPPSMGQLRALTYLYVVYRRVVRAVRDRQLS